MRFALPNRGKSGGVRVLYVDYAFYEKTALMNVYSKSQKSDITDEEKQVLKTQVSILTKGLRK